MYSNNDSIEMFNQMVNMGLYYSSARPVSVDPSIIIEDICTKIPLTPQDTLLDVGCGIGVVTIPLSRRCRFIHALDAGEQVLEAARLRCLEEQVTNVAYHLGSALHLPFEENFFDHVLMYAVIHYLENEKQLKECISELIRVCKPGGRILIAEIPDNRIRQEFEQRSKTPEEMRILKEFNVNRAEYDQLYKEHVHTRPSVTNLMLDCADIVAYAKQCGCSGQVLRQDIRQPLSLTRRDVVLIKNK